MTYHFRHLRLRPVTMGRNCWWWWCVFFFCSCTLANTNTHHSKWPVFMLSWAIHLKNGLTPWRFVTRMDVIIEHDNCLEVACLASNMASCWGITLSIFRGVLARRVWFYPHKSAFIPDTNMLNFGVRLRGIPKPTNVIILAVTVDEGGVSQYRTVMVEAKKK